ncbi:uncharacterized protein LOC125075153 isoform X2 [Vanessa atalanta]|uniref:uncharacterized protein LOC125075153 isoform X2 n=1 Tax=Vanessa atalanta TaxID=42275 RepID=UPI001FCE0177|nr:uncharacterized protein LOC125075153 isoform X2 [Vanessa atalanta]
MILKCFILATALQVVTCISLANELNSNGKLSMNQRKCPLTSDLMGPTVGTDKTTSIYENYFPDVIYPTCILDITEPFYYIANGYDEVLGPFDDDVKSAYRCLSSNNKKTKTNNLPKMFEDERVQCMPVTPSPLSNKNNTCEQNEQKSLLYSNKEFKDICRRNNDSICSEDIITINERNDTETYGYCEFNDIPLISSLYNESETDIQNCDLLESTEYENLTNNVCNGSDEMTETKKYSLLQNTTSDDRHVLIKVKINIELSEVPAQHNVNSTREKLKTFPYEILEYISSGENETFLNKSTNKNYSAEETSVFPEDILNILLNSSNHTDLVFTELITELSSESSEESENIYSLLQFLENNLEITKIELPLNRTICNTPDNHVYIETLTIHVERDENSIIRDNDNSTTEHLAEDLEDYEETDDGDFFLDFIISLDSQCQKNDTIILDNLSDGKQKYIVMYSDESSSEED